MTDAVLTILQEGGISQTGWPPDFLNPYWPEGIPIPEVVDFDQRDQMNAWWRGWHQVRDTNKEETYILGDTLQSWYDLNNFEIGSSAKSARFSNTATGSTTGTR